LGGWIWIPGAGAFSSQAAAAGDAGTDKTYPAVKGQWGVSGPCHRSRLATGHRIARCASGRRKHWSDGARAVVRPKPKGLFRMSRKPIQEILGKRGARIVYSLGTRPTSVIGASRNATIRCWVAGRWRGLAVMSDVRRGVECAGSSPVRATGSAGLN
jgi:hypothetical protein